MKLKFYPPLLDTAREGVARQFLPVNPPFGIRTNNFTSRAAPRLASPNFRAALRPKSGRHFLLVSSGGAHKLSKSRDGWVIHCRVGTRMEGTT